jgi:hypothetical protein
MQQKASLCRQLALARKTGHHDPEIKAQTHMSDATESMQISAT